MNRSVIARRTILIGGAASTLMAASAPGTAFGRHEFTAAYDRSTPITCPNLANTAHAGGASAVSICLWIALT
ncbi:MAG: hypothetical protein ACE369_13650 [Roseovarius sp.]